MTLLAVMTFVVDQFGIALIEGDESMSNSRKDRSTCKHKCEPACVSFWHW